MHHKEISVIYLQFTLYQKKVHSFFFFFYVLLQNHIYKILYNVDFLSDWPGSLRYNFNWHRLVY